MELSTAAGLIGAGLSAIVSGVTLIAGVLELTRTGRLRNQLSKEATLLGATDRSPNTFALLAPALERKAARLAERLEAANYPYFLRHHPWAAVLAASQFLGAVTVFYVQGGRVWFSEQAMPDGVTKTIAHLVYKSQSAMDLTSDLWAGAVLWTYLWVALELIRFALLRLRLQHLAQPLVWRRLAIWMAPYAVIAERRRAVLAATANPDLEGTRFAISRHTVFRPKGPADPSIDQREFDNLTDSYTDKQVYWSGPPGAWRHDAAEHRHYDQMTMLQQMQLARLQRSGRLAAYNDTKPSFRRPWTGALTNEVEDLLADEVWHPRSPLPRKP